MSEWWDRYLFDDLIGLEAAAVASDGSRHIGPFVRFGDYLTVDDTCVFTRKDKGDGVRLMEEVDHVRLRPEEPFWQGRFSGRAGRSPGARRIRGTAWGVEGPLEPFDGVLGLRAGGRGLEYVFGDSGYRFAQPGFVRVRPVEDQPENRCGRQRLPSRRIPDPAARGPPSARRNGESTNPIIFSATAFQQRGCQPNGSPTA
mgnify:CR=1 FL=1